jgi:uncharacterized membrane protein
MSHVVEVIEVDVPVTVAYNQWTQFTDFPHFMEGVEKVQQLDANHLHWVAKIGGSTREWDAEITEQVPDQRISWTAQDGTRSVGTVTFDRVGPVTTKVQVQLDFEPSGVMETVGDKLGFVAAQVRRDLMHFRDFLDERGAATGAWRGEVHDGEPQRSDNPNGVSR